MLLTEAMTGVRQGELLALRWRDVDWKAERIRVRRTGNPSRHRAEAAPTAVAFLRRQQSFLRPPTHWPSTGPRLLSAPLQDDRKAAGVRQVRFHDLRHTLGTRMAASPDVSMRKIQEWMDHRDYRTTLIYADYEPGEDESAMVDDAFS